MRPNTLYGGCDKAGELLKVVVREELHAPGAALALLTFVLLFGHDHARGTMILSSLPQQQHLPSNSKRRFLRVKRAMDVIGSLILLLLFAPLMIVVAILVALDSRGPVIYRQERIGSRVRWEDGVAIWEPKSFTMYKFRTMTSGAPTATHEEYARAFVTAHEVANPDPHGPHALYKLTDDPRVTRVGHALRKYSLDELPQLWNVLAGDMSLVGPRPAMAYEYDVYEDWHKQRLTAIPGLTGLWQVTGRCSVTFDESVRLDLRYIEQQSVLLDVSILMRTLSVVLNAKGGA